MAKRKRSNDNPFPPERILTFVPGVFVRLGPGHAFAEKGQPRPTAEEQAEAAKREVTQLVIPQNHPIQKFCREKLRFKIPTEKKIELDDIGAFVCRAIADEQPTVEALGNALYQAFGEDVEPVFDRLLPYLGYLQYNLKVLADS